MVRRFGQVFLTLTLVSLLACSSDSDENPVAPSVVGGRLAIEQIASSASAEQVDGARRSGSAPASSGGPQITATGNPRVLTGGTQTIAIASASPFTKVYVFVGGRSLGLLDDAVGGIPGYYEIALGSPRTSTTVLLAYPQEIPVEEFDLQFAVADASGAVGPYVPLHTNVLGVGTGDVQVTLAWDAESDVDLHVVGPGGDEIYWDRRESPSGGTLDLDSNAACDIDSVRNENITWPVGRAPRGVYTVRVNYWSNCGVAQTNYTLRINNGGSVQIFTGTLTGPGTRGGLGAGQVVATFERTTGPTAITVGQTAMQAPSGAGAQVSTPAQKPRKR
jgi:hypothetical protein